MPHVKRNIKIDSAGKNPGLIEVLTHVGEHHAKSYGETVNSKTLLELGVKDGLAQYWEGVLENPVGSLYETSQRIENVFTNFANEIVKSFLIKNKIIAQVYRSENSTHELHYCIVLKKDTLENRSKVNKFFSAYYDFKFSQKYPIYFQFVPEALIEKLKVREKLF